MFLGKVARRTWCFCGGIVVKCAVKRGALMVVFLRRKIFLVLNFIFGFFHKDGEAVLFGQVAGRF